MTALTRGQTATPTASTSLRVLTAPDVPATAELLATSFEKDQASVAFVADPERRLCLNTLSSARSLHAAIPHASVYGAEIDGTLAGVAIWHPPGASRGTLTTNLRCARDLAAQLPTLPPVVASLARTLITDRRAAARFASQHRRGASFSKRATGRPGISPFLRPMPPTAVVAWPASCWTTFSNVATRMASPPGSRPPIPSTLPSTKATGSRR